MIAAIRIRGRVKVSADIERTLKLLKLHKPNHCVLLKSTESIEGMLKKVQNYITWGEIDRQTLEELLFKRARKGKKRISKDEAKKYADKIISGEGVDIKMIFRLNPPSKGFKPIRRLYPKGAAGYRGKAINELLMRMI